MSEKALKAVLSKALADENFRKELASTPETAVAKFELSDEERQAIRNLSGNRLELVTRVGERKWGVAL